METETLDKLFLELSQVTKARTAREIELESALEDANRMCRSAMAIAKNDGKANWPAFTDRLRESLERQHMVMHPGQNVPALAARGLEQAPKNHAGDGQPSGLPAAHGSASSEIPTD